MHQFCTLHRIGYNADLDPTCPQCAMGGHANIEQLDFDSVQGSPVKDGVLLDKRTLKPITRFDPATGKPITS